MGGGPEQAPVTYPAGYLTEWSALHLFLYATSCKLFVLYAGYVSATAQTLAHVDLDINVNSNGATNVATPVHLLVLGICSALPQVLLGTYVGVDQTSLTMGLAASLLQGVPLVGWNVSPGQAA